MELTQRAPSIGEDEERLDVVRSRGVDSEMSSAIMRRDPAHQTYGGISLHGLMHPHAGTVGQHS